MGYGRLPSGPYTFVGSILLRHIPSLFGEKNNCVINFSSLYTTLIIGILLGGPHGAM